MSSSPHSDETPSVGRNSLIMAAGTAASRVTGQIRTILLAAALGTTGIAANAYQAGSMIPQAVFALISGGIFNAVLVPQIVRTLKEKDAEDRLNKLITLAIALLLAVTVIMMAGTPLLTRLYVNGNADLIALTNAFTLWCMPQIFFYGLYTVIGQILAAKNHFGMYAWSSVGANVISCIGFTTFIMLFGKADEQPLTFWTQDRIALIAGAWTLGVAFQALILFLPLFRCGIRYRPRWGLGGIGLRSMGAVAGWSIGIVVIDQITNIICTRIMTGAPTTATRLYGMAEYDVAGNATYQNASTLYLLPYSLIAVSVTTAMFPRISQAISERAIGDARDMLSQSLRNVGVLMIFFSVAFLVMPVPIILALLPSVSVKEAILIAAPLMTQGIGLPLSSAYLIIQRTFYAFEDGRSPFVFMALYAVFQMIIVVGSSFLLSPLYWVMMVGVSSAVAHLLAFPFLISPLRRRFGGHLGGRHIATSYMKALLAGAAATVIGLVLRGPVYRLVGAQVGRTDGSMNWLQAVAVCVILTIVITGIYVGVLWLLRSPELTSVIGMVAGRLGPLHRTAKSDDSQPDSTTTPTARMTQNIPIVTDSNGVEASMKPQLGDTLVNRYTLVASLRNETGLEAWKVNDRVLTRDCQLFLVNDRRVVDSVSNVASALALAKDKRLTPVLQLQRHGDTVLIVTQLDAGLSLTHYLSTGRTLGFEAIRSIMGETVQSARWLLSQNIVHHAINTDTVRVSVEGVQLADTPLSIMLQDTSGTALPNQPAEVTVVRQLAALLYALITRTPSGTGSAFDLSRLDADVPGEFKLICNRGLGVDAQGNVAAAVPMSSLAELDALLGDWTPLSQLPGHEIVLTGINGDASISTAVVLPTAADDVAAIPTDIINPNPMPALTLNIPTYSTALDSDSVVDVTPMTGDLFRAFDGSEQGTPPVNRTTIPLNVSSVRHEPIDPSAMQQSQDPLEGSAMLTFPVSPASSAFEQTQTIEPVSAPILDEEPIVTFPAASESARENLNDAIDAGVADQKLLAGMPTKIVAVIVGVIVLVIAGALAVNSLNSDQNIDGSPSSTSDPWSANLNDVPFGDTTNGNTGTDGNDDSSSSDQKNTSGSTDANKSDKSDKSSKDTGKDTVVTKDKEAQATPAPKYENNTALTIASQQFVTDPGGQSGYAYHLHLNQSQTVYRAVINITTSGGHGYIYVNTTGDPTQGEQVADFQFADGGTTEVKFTKAVDTQDVILWVPSGELPQHQLYIQKVEVF